MRNKSHRVDSKNPELPGWHLGDYAKMLERKKAIDSLNVAKQKESDMEDLVRQGLAVKVITPIVRGYRISYKLLNT